MVTLLICILPTSICLFPALLTIGTYPPFEYCLNQQVNLQYYTDNNFGTLITGDLIAWVDRVIGGRLIGV